MVQDSEAHDYVRIVESVCSLEIFIKYMCKYLCQIVQELESYDFYNLFKDIIFPAIITIATILFSVYLSRQEFLRAAKSETLKKVQEDAILREVIVRNTKIVSDRVTEEAEVFLKSFVEGYNIEKGIRPINMLYSFPELEVLDSIDKLKYHSVFYSAKDGERGLSNLYYGIAGITGIQNTYRIISEEVVKINSFISEYDTVLLEGYKKVTSYMEQMILLHQKDSGQTRKVNEEELAEFHSLIREYSSDINNFYLLKINVDKIAELKLFDIVVNENFILYTHVVDSFMLFYLKYQQEILLFHNRIKQLVDRLMRLKEQILLFQNLE